MLELLGVQLVVGILLNQVAITVVTKTKDETKWNAKLAKAKDGFLTSAELATALVRACMTGQPVMCAKVKAKLRLNVNVRGKNSGKNTLQESL